MTVFSIYHRCESFSRLPENIANSLDKMGRQRYDIEKLAYANHKKRKDKVVTMTLREAEIGKEYIISGIETDDDV